MTVHLPFHSVMFKTQNRLHKTSTVTDFGSFRVFKYKIMYEHRRR